MNEIIPDWSVSDTAYIAGIIDGEGCIGIYYGKDKGYFVQLTIVNTNKELLDWLGQRLHANSVKSLKDKRPRNKQSFSLTVDRMRAFEVLTRVRGLLIVKRKQVDLALEFKEWQNARKTDKSGCGHRAYSEEELQICRNFANQSKILNRKGSRKQ